MSEKQKRRAQPQDMPTDLPPQASAMMRGKAKPKDILPEQKPLTDEEFIQKPTPKWVKVLKKILFWVLLAVMLVAVYLLLLVAEPSEDSKDLPADDTSATEVIRMPMTALESTGDTDLQRLTDTFGGEMLTLSAQGLALAKTRVYDTSFQGGYARRVEMTYTYTNGETITAVSIRPQSAVELIKEGSYSLTISSLYELGNLTAARMDSDDFVCVFANADTAAIALFVPSSLSGEVSTLLSQTKLYYPTVE